MAVIGDMVAVDTAAIADIGPAVMGGITVQNFAPFPGKRDADSVIIARARGEIKQA